MKQISNLALISYIITLGLYFIGLFGFAGSYYGGAIDGLTLAYLGLIFGLLAQIALGIIHIIVAIYVYRHYKKLSSGARIALNVYSGVSVFYLITLVILPNLDYNLVDHYIVPAIVAPPMILGGFFVVLMYSIRDLKTKE